MCAALKAAILVNSDGVFVAECAAVCAALGAAICWTLMVFHGVCAAETRGGLGPLVTHFGGHEENSYAAVGACVGGRSEGAGGCADSK